MGSLCNCGPTADNHYDDHHVMEKCARLGELLALSSTDIFF